jgi:hypothetical protein
MVLHIYSLLPTPVPIYGIKTLFKVYTHQLKVCQALHAVPLLDTVHIIPIYIAWTPCHHGMVHPQFADGGDGLQLWRVAANTLNKQPQLQTADKERASSLEVGCGSNNLLP